MRNKCILKMPGVVHSGVNALEVLPSIIAGEARKAAVFTDYGIKKAGLLKRLIELIENVGVDYVVFDDIPAEPSYEQVQEIVDKFKALEADFIIAVGGGSVMDTAKLAGVLKTDEYEIKKLLDDPEKARKCVKTLMIPTTAGTGAEATPNAIVAVPEKELKVGIVNDALIADYVILDPNMILGLPRSIAAATGIDALCHAIECFTSKKKNPFSDLYALEAFELIMKNIEKACDDSAAIDEKNNMLLASFYAGVAIAASGTTAVHALSYPLGGKYHIPHGISNAILLIPVMRFNETACRKYFAEAFDRLKPNVIAESDADKSEWIIARMEQIVKHLDIPTDLNRFGIVKEDVEELVKAGMSVQRLLVNNMKQVTEEDARNIYLQIM